MTEKPHAFPVAAPAVEFGMSLRDYFAAQVAAGDASAQDGWGDNAKVDAAVLLSRAKLYYRVADAMMEARDI